MTVRRLSRTAVPVVAMLISMACRSGTADGWSSRARTMVLISGPTEIAMSSSRVPGYWARPVDAEDRFFLCTRDSSYETGSRIKVEGPFGPASPSIFRDETGEYWKVAPPWRPVFVLVVWKIGRSENAPRP